MNESDSDDPRPATIDRRTLVFGIGLAALIEGVATVALIVRGLRRAGSRGPRRTDLSDRDSRRVQP
jgi:hypothetical protein